MIRSTTLLSHMIASTILLCSLYSCAQPEMASKLELHIAKAKELQAKKQVDNAAEECQKAIAAAEGDDDIRLVELLNDQAAVESDLSPAKVKATIMRAEDMCDRYMAGHEDEATKEWLTQCVRTYTKMAEVHRGLDAIGMAKAVYQKAMKAEVRLGIKPEDSKLRAEYVAMMQGRSKEGDDITLRNDAESESRRMEFRKRLFSVKVKPGESCNAEELTKLHEEARKKFDIEDTNYQTALRLVLSCYTANKMYDRSIVLLTRNAELLQPAEREVDSENPAEDVVVRAEMLMHTYFELATAYRRSGRLHDARKVFNKQIELAKKLKSKELVFGLYGLAEIELEEGNPKLAAELCQQAVTASKQLHAKRDVLSTVLIRLTIAYARCDEIEKAKTALKDAENNSSKSNIGLAGPAMEIATALARMGRYLEAMEMDRIAQKYLANGDNPEALADVSLQIADIKAIQGDLSGAEADYRAIAKDSATRKDIAREVRALSGVAAVLRDRHQFKESNKVMQEAISRANEKKDFSIKTLIDLYHTDGVTRSHSGDYAEARKSLAKMVELERSLKRGNKRIAMAIMQLASVNAASKQSGPALRNVDEALGLLDQETAKSRPLEHLYTTTMAVSVCHQCGADKRAQEIWKKALTYFRENEASIKERSLNDAYLLWLADNARFAGDLQSAKNFYDAYFISLHQHDAVGTYTMYIRYAEVLQKLKDKSKARRMKDMAEALRLKLEIPKDGDIDSPYTQGMKLRTH